jgi:hypothetical protein
VAVKFEISQARQGEQMDYVIALPGVHRSDPLHTPVLFAPLFSLKMGKGGGYGLKSAPPSSQQTASMKVYVVSAARTHRAPARCRLL